MNTHACSVLLGSILLRRAEADEQSNIFWISFGETALVPAVELGQQPGVPRMVGASNGKG